MQWSDTILEYIQQLKPVTLNAALAQRMAGLIDLTSLNANDTEASVAALCEKAHTAFGPVAAVCVYPQFVSLPVAAFAGTPIKVATVANFPLGSSALEVVMLEIGCALRDGAQEVDVVFPYERYLAGERQYAHTFVAACKAACGDHVTLKVILETGVLRDVSIIADATFDVLAAGADFVKTSTGKLAEGASLEAAATMLLAIKHISPQLKRQVGIKVAGGLRDLTQAAHYIELADLVMGRDWVNSATFRMGSSQLVDELAALSCTGGMISH